MEKSLKKGQLAFLPSDLTLLQFDKASSNGTTGYGAPVQKFCKTSSPSHVLVIECKTETPYCVVLYNGEFWSALKTDVYPTEKFKS